MLTSRTPEHDVAKRINVVITVTTQVGDGKTDNLTVELHSHVGADLRTQTNEEAGKWIKAIIDRVVRKELET